MATTPLEVIHKVIDAVKGALKKGQTKPDTEKLNAFIKKNSSGDLMDFAHSAVEYFKNGKLKWDGELAILQNEYAPGGMAIIPWPFLKKQLMYAGPSVESKLPKAFTQHVKAESGYCEKIKRTSALGSTLLVKMQSKYEGLR